MESIPHEMSHLSWFVRFVTVFHIELSTSFIHSNNIYVFISGISREIAGEYKQNKYRDDLSSVTSGLDSLYEYINSGPVDFKM